jgi:anti-sigma regulatory factor (Ser/Thr protein kinase)
MRSQHSPAPPEATALEPDAAGVVPRELRLSAEPAQLATARDHVERAARAMGFDARGTHEIVFAVNEAVTNAIRHGRPDREGTIGLMIEDDGQGLNVVVTDSGSFLPTVPDESPMADHGRGFVFMSSLMDHVELTRCPEGTMVRMRKRRNGASPNGPDEHG